MLLGLPTVKNRMPLVSTHELQDAPKDLRSDPGASFRIVWNGNHRGSRSFDLSSPREFQ
jgi:hypothetical protein